MCLVSSTSKRQASGTYSKNVIAVEGVNKVSGSNLVILRVSAIAFNTFSVVSLNTVIKAFVSSGIGREALTSCSTLLNVSSTSFHSFIAPFT